MSTSFSAPVLDEEQSTVEKRGLRKFLASLKKYLKEPLIQFLLIGIVLFGLYSWMQRGPSQVQSDKEIRLTMDDLRQLDIYFQSQWRRPPTPAEFRALIENKIREEILYREALALGLDKDDTIVKRRMAQKMEFLSEDLANAHEPTTQELKTWFEKNKKDFTLPGRITFRHLYFSPDHRGQHSRKDAEKVLSLIHGKPADWSGSKNLADPFMFQDYYGDRTLEQLAKDFGPDFAHSLFQLKAGSWQGPIQSGYGWHLIWIDSMTPGSVRQFEEVEPDVKTAWMAAKRQDNWDKTYSEMRKKYQVYLPQPPETPASSAQKTQ